MSMQKCHHCGNIYEGANTICGCHESIADVTIEPTTEISLSTLKWWRELVDLNPQDLAPRMDERIKAMETK